MIRLSPEIAQHLPEPPYLAQCLQGFDIQVDAKQPKNPAAMER